MTLILFLLAGLSSGNRIIGGEEAGVKDAPWQVNYNSTVLKIDLFGNRCLSETFSVESLTSVEDQSLLRIGSSQRHIAWMGWLQFSMKWLQVSMSWILGYSIISVFPRTTQHSSSWCTWRGLLKAFFLTNQVYIIISDTTSENGNNASQLSSPLKLSEYVQV